MCYTLTLPIVIIDSIWKDRYKHQVEINKKLEGELAEFSRQLQELKLANKQG